MNNFEIALGIVASGVGAGLLIIYLVALYQFNKGSWSRNDE